ncbi:MAG: hypothetical protein H6742_05335 [Alphaproteobacteria bacterium]|nr:hypothetical protein [Alphaproteobacteria bacterium]
MTSLPALVLTLSPAFAEPADPVGAVVEEWGHARQEGPATEAELSALVRACAAAEPGACYRAGSLLLQLDRAAEALPLLEAGCAQRELLACAIGNGTGPEHVGVKTAARAWLGPLCEGPPIDAWACDQYVLYFEVGEMSEQTLRLCRLGADGRCRAAADVLQLEPERARALFDEACEAGSAVACGELAVLDRVAGLSACGRDDLEACAVEARQLAALEYRASATEQRAGRRAGRLACTGGRADACPAWLQLAGAGRELPADPAELDAALQALCDAGDAARCVERAERLGGARGLALASARCAEGQGPSCRAVVGLMAGVDSLDPLVTPSPELWGALPAGQSAPWLEQGCRAGDPVSCGDLWVHACVFPDAERRSRARQRLDELQAADSFGAFKASAHAERICGD